MRSNNEPATTLIRHEDADGFTKTVITYNLINAPCKSDRKFVEAHSIMRDMLSYASGLC